MTITAKDINEAIENIFDMIDYYKDYDFDYESSNLTKNEILQQSGSTVLGEANELPQYVIDLFQ